MTISLTPLGSTSTGLFDQAASEIVAHDASNPNLLFVSNSAANSVSIVNIADPNTPVVVETISLAEFGGNVNSVAVHDGVVAVAVQNATATANGQVVFFDTEGNFLGQAPAGVWPDMLTFTSDGTRIFVANEGEGASGPGSVTIIDLSGGPGSATSITVGFTQFDDEVDALRAEGVRIADGALPSNDFEPEYITVSGNLAYVTLQEANAIAVLDLQTGQFVDIIGLGTQDYSSGDGVDASDQDGIDITNLPMLSYFQPDGIAAYQAGGQTYLVTANEGDVRDGEQSRVSSGNINLDDTLFPNEQALKAADVLGRLNAYRASDFGADPDRDGDIDNIIGAGGRSFSIWDTQGNLVFDSGADFERITARVYPEFFNASNTNNELDNRSDDKGPEPEGVTIGVIDGRTYAFVGLERTGGIMVYDITDPTDAEFVQYINTRNFDEEPGENSGGDLAPEGLAFISAEDSPTGQAMLAVGFEVSGTTRLFAINVVETDPDVRTGSQRADSILGDIAGDTINGAAGNDVLDGWSGNDVIDGGTGNDSLLGDSGEDTISGGQGNDLLVGDTGDDTLDGANHDDTVFGDNGNDTLSGSDGNDAVLGGDGNDLVSGGRGHDSLQGDDGADTLTGGDGNDAMFGAAGDDDVNGGNDHDIIDGSVGNDIVRGDAGNDTLWGGDGIDRLYGGDGNDGLDGGDGNDTVWGGKGNDLIDGGAGHDVVDLGAGRDSYVDNAGNDTISVGDGARDVLFYAADAAGTDTVLGWDDGPDVIDLSDLYGEGSGPANFGAFHAGGGSITDLRASTAQGGVVQVVMETGGASVLIHVDAGETITQADFLFH
jgi:Ca2+-binding RTX toxin-like protein